MSSPTPQSTNQSTSQSAPTPAQLADRKRRESGAIYRKHLGTPQYIVNLSRQYTSKAISTLADILEDDAQPVVARIKCAALLLERGYGKAPQAVLIADTTDQTRTGVHGLSVLDRIKALKEAKSAPSVLDLEASEVRDVIEVAEGTPDEPPLPLSPEESPI